MKKILYLLLFVNVSSFLIAKTVNDPIATLVAVGPMGEGNEAAAKAWPKVADLRAEALPDLLTAMDKASGIGQNWLRAAVDTIVQRTLKEDKKLPTKELNDFLANTKHIPASRRLAFELIQKASPKRAAKLIPSFIDDPAPELRRDAVALIIEKAVGESNEDSACSLYEKALAAARDVDQIELTAEALREKNRVVDLPEIMGFLMRWKVIGPFDNTDRKGFAVPYPPEKKIDFSATYDGKKDKVKWTDFSTTDQFGKVDINLEYGELKQVVAYAHNTFQLSEARELQFRLGCKNAWKVWLNGELLFAREEYHRGQRIDQYVFSAKLKKGKNEILVKFCQNEQQQSWTKQWEFQMRVTDATGTAVLADNRLPTPKTPAAKR
jgi:hypothetical protein